MKKIFIAVLILLLLVICIISQIEPETKLVIEPIEQVLPYQTIKAQRPTSEEISSTDYWYDNYAGELYSIGQLYINPDTDTVSTASFKSVKDAINNRIKLGLIPTEHLNGFQGYYFYYEMSKEEFEYWGKALYGDRCPNFTSDDYSDFVSKEFFDSSIDYTTVTEIRPKAYSNFSIVEQFYSLEILDSSNPDEVKIMIKNMQSLKSKSIDLEYHAVMTWDEAAGYLVRDVYYRNHANTSIVIHGDYTPIEVVPSPPPQSELYNSSRSSIEITENYISILNPDTKVYEKYDLPVALLPVSDEGAPVEPFLNYHNISSISPDRQNIVLTAPDGIYICELTPNALPRLLKKNPPTNEESPDFSVYLTAERFLDDNNILLYAVSWEHSPYTEIIDITGEQIAKFDINRGYPTINYDVDGGQIIVHANSSYDDGHNNIFTIDYTTHEMEKHDWIPFVSQENLWLNFSPIENQPWRGIISTSLSDPETNKTTESKLYLVDLKEKTIDLLPLYAENVSLFIKRADSRSIYFSYKTEQDTEKIGKFQYS